MNGHTDTSDKTVNSISWKQKEELKELITLKIQVKDLQRKLIESEKTIKELNKENEKWFKESINQMKQGKTIKYSE